MLSFFGRGSCFASRFFPLVFSFFCGGSGSSSERQERGSGSSGIDGSSGSSTSSRQTGGSGSFSGCGRVIDETGILPVIS
ncbi:MAG: hypothetical protein CVV04_09700 [Firmicutes bacterium HGW-Firmicutes-9]|nr:MAG: hypothetical protein CVV04_09700 [Firmicutes bacterium HGW-Firmicutes-9]